MKHPKVEVYIDLYDISYMEREIRPQTSLVLPNERDYFTALSMKNGKTIVVENTPEEIVEMMHNFDD